MRSEGIAIALAEKYSNLGVYREVVDMVPVPTVITGKDGSDVHVNPSYSALFLIGEDVAVRAGWKSVVAKSDSSRIDAVWKRVVSTKTREWSTKAKLVVGHDEMECSIKASRLSNGGYVVFIFPSCGNVTGCPVHAGISKGPPVCSCLPHHKKLRE